MLKRRERKWDRKNKGFGQIMGGGRRNYEKKKAIGKKNKGQTKRKPTSPRGTLGVNRGRKDDPVSQSKIGKGKGVKSTHQHKKKARSDPGRKTRGNNAFAFNG